jgi:hypothetical protein
MNSRSKKERLEWSLFINPATGKVQYNRQCRRCIYTDCKQSYRVAIIFCKNYTRKEVPVIYSK